MTLQAVEHCLRIIVHFFNKESAHRIQFRGKKCFVNKAKIECFVLRIWLLGRLFCCFNSFYCSQRYFCVYFGNHSPRLCILASYIVYYLALR